MFLNNLKLSKNINSLETSLNVSDYGINSNSVKFLGIKGAKKYVLIYLKHRKHETNLTISSWFKNEGKKSWDLKAKDINYLTNLTPD